MSIRIDRTACRGCGRCAEDCPGNLIRTDEEGKALLRRPEDCWGCASCLKACAFGAIAMALDAEAGGLGGLLRVRAEGPLRHWTVSCPDGREIVVTVDARVSNRY